jgi:hypothetical protein
MPPVREAIPSEGTLAAAPRPRGSVVWWGSRWNEDRRTVSTASQFRRSQPDAGPVGSCVGGGSVPRPVLLSPDRSACPPTGPPIPRPILRTLSPDGSDVRDRSVSSHDRMQPECKPLPAARLRIGRAACYRRRSAGPEPRDVPWPGTVPGRSMGGAAGSAAGRSLQRDRTALGKTSGSSRAGDDSRRARDPRDHTARPGRPG